MGGKEESRPEERIPFKVWKMLTPEARLAIKNGGEVKIGIVKEVGAKENKRGGGRLYLHHKKLRNKLLRFTLTYGRPSDP